MFKFIIFFLINGIQSTEFTFDKIGIKEPHLSLFVSKSIPSLIRNVPNTPSPHLNQKRVEKLHHNFSPSYPLNHKAQLQIKHNTIQLQPKFRPSQKFNPSSVYMAQQKYHERDHQTPHEFQSVYTRNGDKTTAYTINNQLPDTFPPYFGKSSHRVHFKMGNSEYSYGVHRFPEYQPNAFDSFKFKSIGDLPLQSSPTRQTSSDETSVIDQFLFRTTTRPPTTPKPPVFLFPEIRKSRPSTYSHPTTLPRFNQQTVSLNTNTNVRNSFSSYSKLNPTPITNFNGNFRHKPIENSPPLFQQPIQMKPPKYTNSASTILRNPTHNEPSSFNYLVHKNVPKHLTTRNPPPISVVKVSQSFGQKESQSNGVTHGKYFVNLPNGRTQIVKYYADSTGYHPTIKYVDTKKFTGLEHYR